MVEKKNIFFLLLFILFSVYGFSQFYIERDVFGACGQVDYQLNNKIVDYTVGEPITETFSVQINNTTRYATQGFHQPGLFKYALYSTNAIYGLDVEELALESIALYPNPNEGDFYIELSNSHFSEALTYSICDQLGRVIQKGELNQFINHVQIGHVPGTYYLNVGESNFKFPFVIY